MIGRFVKLFEPLPATNLVHLVQLSEKPSKINCEDNIMAVVSINWVAILTKVQIEVYLISNCETEGFDGCSDRCGTNGAVSNTSVRNLHGVSSANAHPYVIGKISSRIMANVGFCY